MGGTFQLMFMDRPTDRRSNKAPYTVACLQLKTEKKTTKYHKSNLEKSQFIYIMQLTHSSLITDHSPFTYSPQNVPAGMDCRGQQNDNKGNNQHQESEIESRNVEREARSRGDVKRTYIFM